MATVQVSGKSLKGINRSFLARYILALQSIGATRVRIISAVRSPSSNQSAGGVSDSKHLTGNAIDAMVYVNNQWVPAGTALKNVASQFGLRSGDQPGFFNGQPDPNHVDNALVDNSGNTINQSVGNDKTPPSGKYSFQQLEALWITAGGSQALAPTMAAIALAESGGDPTKHNTNGQSFDPKVTTGDDSYGLWQINYNGYLRESRTVRFGPASSMYDPLNNARAAVAIAAGGKGLTNWSTYKNHLYQGYLPGAGGGISISGVLDPFGVGHDIKTAVTDPFGIKGLGKDVMYISVILGGGAVILLGLALIGLDLGISAFKVADKAPPVRLARKVTSSRRASASREASQESRAASEARRQELHEARVKTEKARATDLRSRSRARTTAARKTKAEREAAERSAYIRGAADASNPTLTNIRKKRAS